MWTLITTEEATVGHTDLFVLLNLETGPVMQSLSSGDALSLIRSFSSFISSPGFSQRLRPSAMQSLLRYAESLKVASHLTSSGGGGGPGNLL